MSSEEIMDAWNAGQMSDEAAVQQIVELVRAGEVNAAEAAELCRRDYCPDGLEDALEEIEPSA